MTLSVQGILLFPSKDKAVRQTFKSGTVKFNFMDVCKLL